VRLLRSSCCFTHPSIGGRLHWRREVGAPSTTAFRVVGLSRMPLSAFLCFPCGGALLDLTAMAQGGNLRELPPSARALPVFVMCFSFEASSHAARPVARRLLQGFPKIPLRRHTRWSPLPSSPRGSDFGKTLPRAPLVPSSWFRTTSTASSSSRAVSLLHLTADPEVHRVSAHHP